ncbi:MAG: response regulator transcription factor [Methylocystis sp.]|uniref:response regulator transcription factor n=1 Tax=Methylocystis sp. TaxID=1911079 RepID=UPI003D0AEB10
MRILLIEDEKEMARLVASLVAHSGFQVDVVASIDCALEGLREHSYDLLLLDRRLPDGDGASIIKSARQAQPGIRVILLTALDALGDKVSGLNAGADDYLTKPFQGEELVARIRACLRRPGGDARPPIVVGSLSYDLQTDDVLINGAAIKLSRRELMLLKALMQRVSRVTSRESLLTDIYGFQDDVMATALDTIVSRLRRRLSEFEARVEIHTVRGRGYLLAEKGP